MQQSVMAPRAAAAVSGEVPWPVRFLGKLVLEILPAALASVIGGLVFAHYQFERPADPVPAAAPAAAEAPATPEMVRLVRDEHAMIRQFLQAQTAAAAKRVAAADAQDARAVADAKLAEQARRRAALALAAKPLARTPRVTVAYVAPAFSAPAFSAPAFSAPAFSAPAVPPPAATPLVLAASAVPAATPTRHQPFLVAETLAVKDHVVGVALHAVMSIGGIPSWIGHRLGAADLDPDERPFGAAS